MLADVVAQVAAGEQVHHEVEVLSILEGTAHVDDEAADLVMTTYLCFNMDSSCSSFITDVTLFLDTILTSLGDYTWPWT